MQTRLLHLTSIGSLLVALLVTVLWCQGRLCDGNFGYGHKSMAVWCSSSNGCLCLTGAMANHQAGNFCRDMDEQGRLVPMLNTGTSHLQLNSIIVDFLFTSSLNGFQTPKGIDFWSAHPPIYIVHDRANLEDFSLPPLHYASKRSGRVTQVSFASVTFPDGLALCVLGIAPLTDGIATVRKRRRDATSFRCTACRYDLRATPLRCPECGRKPENRTASALPA